IVDTTNITTSGGSDGTIKASAYGGTASYTYSWSNTSQTTETVTGLSANINYCVTVTDANGCIATDCITLTQPSGFNIYTFGTDVNCTGGSDGTARVSVDGFFVPFTYAWTGGDTDTSLTGLSIGTYFVTVIDANNDTVIGNVVVTEPTALSVSATVSDVSCNGGCDGSVDITPSGGTPAYTYSWTNNATSQDISSICQGTYTVTVTDNNGCKEVASAIINEPTALSVSLAKSDVSCDGGTDGDATATPSGGTGPYTYSWNNNQTTQTASNLGAGSHCVTVTDAKGCKVNSCITITEPTALTITSLIGTDASCSGSCDGSADLTVSGGTPSYTYDWTNSATSQDLIGLCTGTYTVTVTDTKGCKTGSNVVISEPSGLTISVIGTNASCAGLCDGASDVSPSGGTGPYTYKWSNGATTQATQSLCAGVYNVTVFDNNGCKLGDNVTITEPETLKVVSIIGTNLMCKGDGSGAIDLTASGGTQPYTYFWSGGNAVGATTEDVSGLGADNHAVVVTDDNGCQVASNKTLTEPNGMTLTLTGTNLSCFQNGSGAIDLTVSGGTAPFTYSWSNSSTTQNISSLDTGKYVIVVTDDNSCSTADSLNLIQPNELTSSVTGTNVLCKDGATGAADLTVTGGTGPYTYSWSPNGETTEDIGSLVDDTYTVQIMDNNGCITFDQIVITEPTQLTMSFTQTNVSCFGGTDGAIDVTVAGGTQPYTYAWSPAGTTEDLTSIILGSYSVEVTDANGCKVSDNMTITQPVEISITTDSTDALCKGSSDGTASAVAANGTAPYQYSWSNGASGQNANNLTAGAYCVTVTDDNGCQAVKCVVVNEPELLVSTISNVVNASCNGYADGSMDLTVSGGIKPYSYDWNPDTTQNLSGKPAAIYTVIVTDANGCTSTATDTITEPIALVVIRILSERTCKGFNDGSLQAQVVGGTLPYDYIWSTGATGDSILSDLYSGTYTVTAKDKNGCVAIRTGTVDEFPGVEAIIDVSSYEESILAPVFYFADSSNPRGDIEGWEWDFGDGTTDIVQHPGKKVYSTEIEDTGYYDVTLIVVNQFECKDTAVITIRVKPESAIFIPNAFTPGDNNGLNDTWGVKSQGLKEFKLYVYNRWGEMIFKTEDPNELWNGRRNNDTGMEMSPDGVYPYVIFARDHEGKAFRKFGHVTLLK
ncbi:MAG: hypothetical protein COC01_07350, partial [Bacteroidetes bacterium]